MKPGSLLLPRGIGPPVISMREIPGARGTLRCRRPWKRPNNRRISCSVDQMPDKDTAGQAQEMGAKLTDEEQPGTIFKIQRSGKRANSTAGAAASASLRPAIRTQKPSYQRRAAVFEPSLSSKPCALFLQATESPGQITKKVLRPKISG
jgi:hypothetical protein